MKLQITIYLLIIQLASCGLLNKKPENNNELALLALASPATNTLSTQCVTVMHSDSDDTIMLGDGNGENIYSTGIQGYFAAISSDLQTIYPTFLNNGYNIKSVSLIDGAEQNLLGRSYSNGFEVTNPQMSPDGTRLTFMGKDDSPTFHDVYVANTDGSGVKQLTFVTDKNDAYPAWKSDSVVTYSGTRNGGTTYQLYQYDLSTDTETAITGTQDYTWHDWDGDTVVALNGATSDIEILDTSTGQKTVITGNFYSSKVFFLPNGRIIYHNLAGPNSRYDVLSNNREGTDEVNLTNMDDSSELVSDVRCATF